jgi:predicted molibdopterin-dependent oxidoreductase YjgC
MNPRETAGHEWASSDAGSEKSKVITDTGYSLTAYDSSHEAFTLNAPYEEGTMSRKVKGLNVLRSEELVEINPQDAAKLNIADGDKVRVVSRRGVVTAKAKLTEASPAGLVFMTFHFKESAATC